MNKINKKGGTSNVTFDAGPVQDYLAELHRRISQLRAGKVADYIPELSKADPDLFGIALATVDGELYSTGDAEQAFTIQSVSKPFMYGYALEEHGRDFVLRHVGVEPTGEAFNSIVLDEATNRPFNPMVNAGAIAVAAMLGGKSLHARVTTMLDLFSRLAGRKLAIDEAVFHSEQTTGHRNRAIAYMMLNTAMIVGEPEEVLGLYFRQCSVAVTCKDLALMAATLANDGTHPITGDSILSAQSVRDVLTVMNSCGMYNYAGQWSYEVGMPAKSGVSGCILAVVPGQIGLTVYSPPLDPQGNSVRGIKVCQEISRQFDLHAFNNRANVRDVIRREYRGDAVRSKRLRSAEERTMLSDAGGAIVVLEVQGSLFFGSTERLLRRVAQVANAASYVILDFRRVNFADASSCKLIAQAVRSVPGQSELILSDLGDDGPLSEITPEFDEVGYNHSPRFFADTDAALEWCEDRILARSFHDGVKAKYALAELNIFKGLTPNELRKLETIVRPLMFEKGDVIMREGDEAKLVFVLARGSVSVQIRVPDHDGGERKKRVASIGPGLTFGEMALLDGGKRSADIVADERVICYGLSVEQLEELGVRYPAISKTILSNLSREFSERLRQANEEIRALV
jgi:glutaminase